MPAAGCLKWWGEFQSAAGLLVDPVVGIGEDAWRGQKTKTL